MKISPSLQRLDPSPTLRINERVGQLWAEGKQVFHLGFGESRFPVHPKLQVALAANGHQKSYLAGQGLAMLREQIAEFYSQQHQLSISPEQVIVGPGSKALIYALQMALAGDLILPTPSWVSYAPQAGMLGKRVHFATATPENGYELRLEAVAEAVAEAAPGQKILLLNSPNNPTGRMLDAPFLTELAALCRREEVIVLSDEIYGLVPHGHKPHLSLARFYPEGTVILGGLSKHLSLGGWRLGVAVVPEGENGRFLLERLRAIASEIWSTPTAPVQYAACLAYSNDTDLTNYIAECAQLHAARTQHLWSWLNELGVRCPQPDGGFYLFPNFDRWREPLAQRGVHTSDDLADYLLETYQIATLPGSGFGVPPHELSLRLATSYVDMETDEKAERLLAAAREVGDTARLMEIDQPMMAAVIGRLQQFVESLNS